MLMVQQEKALDCARIPKIRHLDLNRRTTNIDALAREAVFAADTSGACRWVAAGASSGCSD